MTFNNLSYPQEIKYNCCVLFNFIYLLNSKIMNYLHEMMDLPICLPLKYI